MDRLRAVTDCKSADPRECPGWEQFVGRDVVADIVTDDDHRKGGLRMDERRNCDCRCERQRGDVMTVSHFLLLRRSQEHKKCRM